MSETEWAAIGSIATAAGFLVVAWQSYLTRKAVKVSQDALEVAQNALVASETVAIDAARARLDAQAPAVSVRLTDIEWPPYAWTPSGMPVGHWPAGYEWHFPEKENERIVLQARVVLENKGDRYVNVEYDGDLVKEVERRPQPATPHALWPLQGNGLNPNLFLQKEFTVKELSENYEARKEGRPLPHRVTGTITVHDSRDNGVTDVWELELTGCPVRPHESRASVWLVDTDTGPDAWEYVSHPPYERTYWVSRRRGDRLPDPTYTLGTSSPQSLPPSSPPQLP
ncbi:hypothetical protein PV518_33780 [Streptomyces sp. ND04-05B]|uniref:hypothetical protein n=1 Tax=Streptomyces sp. ND04-05B TaxID=3028693 RepID=UPI0029ACF113|nr:hypothetical protein [Streptomyces sp. ND04-05B]MDX3067089.1 hypothetical protein [Streptomyces sp. ND04-05B]